VDITANVDADPPPWCLARAGVMLIAGAGRLLLTVMRGDALRILVARGECAA
jgi:hypothetical protein